MNDKNIRLVTAESVRAGHPDKLCDQIADAALDAYLEQDPKAKVALEVLATKNAICIAGEVTANAHVAFDEILLEIFNRSLIHQSCRNRVDGFHIHARRAFLKKVFRAAAREKPPAPARTPPGHTAASPCRPAPAQPPGPESRPRPAHPSQLRAGRLPGTAPNPGRPPRHTGCTPRGVSNP